jgi:hypothetical protein
MPPKTALRKSPLLTILVDSVVLPVVLPVLAALSLSGWDHRGAQASAAEAARADFYVSPQGDDRWSGTLAEPNPQRTDGPLATPERARDAVRQLRGAQKLDRPVTVLLRGGTYGCPKPLVLRPEDSGTDVSPTIYESYPGEKAVLSGGTAVSGWQPDKGPLWKADLPEVKSGAWYFRQLFVEGKRRARPRLPKEGMHTVAGLPKMDTSGWMGTGPEAKSPVDLRAFQFKPGDIRKDWVNLDDVEVVVLQFWMEARLRIKQIDEKNHAVLFTGGSWRPLTWSGGYYVDNVFEALDTPGTWYLDRKQGVLYYHPLPGEDMRKVEVIAPRARQLVRLEGDARTGKPIRNVVFRGLSFQHTDWTLPPEGFAYIQAEIAPPAAITADGAVGCRIERCELAHLGAWGIELRRGCRDNAIAENLMRDLGAGCIKIGEPENCTEDADETCRTTVADNRLLDAGQVYLGSSAVWIGQSSGNTVSHNEISGPLMWAVSVGWTWSYFPLQRARDNVVEFNHAHHVGTGILGSHCAIYALGTSPGTVIRNNYVHHVFHSTFWPGAGEGIILDNGCCGILVENNLVHDAVAGGFGTNFNCFGNIIQNNIFAYGREYQLTVYGDQPSGRHEPKGEVFARNILIWDEGPLIKEADWPAFSTLWDYNVYYHAGGKPVSFMKYTFDQWKAKWLDRNSVVADPLFVDAKNRNFALRPESPALKLGFRPIDISTVGPRTTAGKGR